MISLFSCFFSFFSCKFYCQKKCVILFRCVWKRIRCKKILVDNKFTRNSSLMKNLWCEDNQTRIAKRAEEEEEEKKKNARRVTFVLCSFLFLWQILANQNFFFFSFWLFLQSQILDIRSKNENLTMISPHYSIHCVYLFVKCQ